VAAAGRRLGVPVLVVVPATTTARARAMIELEGATVLVHGESWVDAHAHALGLLRAEDAMIHPFDDPLLWTGHSTLVDELAAAGPVPDAIVLSVGGGGLLGGVLEGLDRHGWSRVGVVAAETAGADSFAQAHAAGRPVTLPGITSIATSLGARTVSATVLERARTHRVEPVVVTDRQAVEACLALADEHRVIVEPACGAALAALTAPSAVLADAREVVVIVCGGVAATLAQLETWSRTLPSPG
jgi:L-serine/L-threonine ammonia-lyase